MQHLTILVLVALTRPVREAAGIEASGSRNVGIVLSLHVPLVREALLEHGGGGKAGHHGQGLSGEDLEEHLCIILQIDVGLRIEMCLNSRYIDLTQHKQETVESSIRVYNSHKNKG